MRNVAAALAMAVALLVNVPVTCRAATPPHLDAAQISALDELGAATLAKQAVPGFSLTIARDGAVLYAKGFGLRDVAAKLPVDRSTIFPIGSITKQFTAAAIELLVRDGRLTLDAPVATYLPDAPHAGSLRCATCCVRRAA